MAEAKKTPARRTSKPKEPEAPKIPPIGAHIASEHFNLSITKHGGGAPLLNVSRKGWVGPSQLAVHAKMLPDLIAGLQELLALGQEPVEDE